MRALGHGDSAPRPPGVCHARASLHAYTFHAPCLCQALRHARCLKLKKGRASRLRQSALVAGGHRHPARGRSHRRPGVTHRRPMRGVSHRRPGLSLKHQRRPRPFSAWTWAAAPAPPAEPEPAFSAAAPGVPAGALSAVAAGSQSSPARAAAGAPAGSMWMLAPRSTRMRPPPSTCETHRGRLRHWAARTHWKAHSAGPSKGSTVLASSRWLGPAQVAVRRTHP